MAREKRTPHRSPNSLADANRDITSGLAVLVYNQNMLEHRQALVNLSVPEETPVPVGFAAQTVNEAQKPKRQRDLEKARNILDRRQNGQSVTWAELDWAKTVCAREANSDEAGREEATSTEMKQEQWQDDEERRIEETDLANRDPIWTTRMLLRVRLGEGDKSDSESDSGLSSPGGVSDVAALEHDRAPQIDSDESEESSTRELEDENDDAEEEDKDAEVPWVQPYVAFSSPLGDSNNDMIAEGYVTEEYVVDIWDDDAWVIYSRRDEEH
ncbi:hypothetical protein G6011_08635 [Alternaria panax]|uniref:Uncharacterized protein n=1 Tax=Alternaria panax TaxID=48097 RepID=A0AAD4FIR6_9PLEO|nr:hypothetical protein G6011_08635 [Alternaria panax]